MAQLTINLRIVLCRIALARIDFGGAAAHREEMEGAVGVQGRTVMVTMPAVCYFRMLVELPVSEFA